MNFDPRNLKSSGITFLNTDNVQSADESATIIVVGVPRSGTTMVAGCLRHLSIFIGDKADNAVNEDIDIANAIEFGRGDLLSSIVSNRNDKYSIWGFKRPSAFKQINNYLSVFRNPKFIIVYRDIAAIAKRNQISMQMDFLKALRLAADDMLKLTNFVSEMTAPAMVMSYEKSLQEPRKFVEALARFCGKTPTEDVVDRAVRSIENGPTAYLDASRVRFEGRLDRVKDGFAGGWARRIGHPHPLTIVITARQEIVGRGSASLFREDLKKAGKGDGRCAFRIKLSQTDLSKDDVVATIEGSRFQLTK